MNDSESSERVFLSREDILATYLQRLAILGSLTTRESYSLYANLLYNLFPFGNASRHYKEGCICEEGGWWDKTERETFTE